jgi:hypothetical protein
MERVCTGLVASEKSCPDLDASSSKRQRCYDSAPIRDAAGCHHRNPNPIRNLRDQSEGAYERFSG